MDKNEVYNLFVVESKRLYPNESVQDIAVDFVFTQISDEEGGVRLFNRGLPVFNEELLQDAIVCDKTVIALNYMVKSKDYIEFENHLPRESKISSSEFDGLLADILKSEE